MDLYASEAALLGALGAAVAAADPDILLGYEVQRASLGYAAERAAALGLPSLLRALSRLPRVRRWGVEGAVPRCLDEGGRGPAGDWPLAQPSSSVAPPAPCPGSSLLLQTAGEKEGVGGGGSDNPADEYAWQTSSGLYCSGRIVLNVWRLMKDGGLGQGLRGGVQATANLCMQPGMLHSIRITPRPQAPPAL